MSSSSEFRTFVPEACRKAVRGGIEKIVSRITAGEKTTSIVVPPRCGKSNIARQASIELVERGVIGPSIILSPWMILRGQMNDKEKVAEMVKHHNIKNAPFPPEFVAGREITRPPDPNFFRNHNPKRYWFSMSMQLAFMPATRLVLTNAAEQCAAELRPMVVFIDEGQMTSSEDDEGWGGLARDLSCAGALLVLLTGTPDRSDNLSPYGFATKREDTEEIKFWGRHEPINEETYRVRQYVGEKTKYRLEADYEYSLQEAWQDGIISKIDSQRFKFISDSDNVEDLSESDGMRALAAAVRNPEVIANSTGMLLKELSLRRYENNSDYGRPEVSTAGIIYVGSDKTGEAEDWHAREVKRSIGDQWSKHLREKPKIIIATMNTDNNPASDSAAKAIADFTGKQAIGDILIVKMMGGVGLDCARLKVGLDLSTIRQRSNFTQRLARIWTSLSGVNHGTMIMPNDPLTRRMWREIVASQGGEFSRVENVTEIGQIVKRYEPTTPPLPTPAITGFERAGSIDNTNRPVGTDLDLRIDRVLANSPILAVRFTRREIGDLMEAGTIVMPGEDGCSDSPQDPPEVPVYDLDAEIAKRHAAINDMCKDLATRIAGPYNKADIEEKWAVARKTAMSQAKSHAGILCELAACDDISKLNKALSWLDGELRSKWKR